VRKVKQHLGDQIQIFSAGAEWDPVDHGLKGVVENLGLLGYTATGALYRTCDAGVVMMMTRHPSYLPMELMACGSLVITNENRYTRWLLEHERNCLLSETSASAVADAIVRGLEDDSLRKKITAQAAQEVRSQHSNWEAQAEKIYQYIVNKS
jgi:glycosyltransferase involved in cell wall biosynthesis